jgi:hypothetical protein
MREDSVSEMDDEVQKQRRKIEPAQWWLIALIVASSGGSLLYLLLFNIHLWQSGAMFIGVPAFIAIVLALAPKAKTATGGVVKGITLALLIVAPMLGEGYVCILMASPLFYLVGILIGWALDRGRDRRKTTLSCVVLLLLPMCLEGVVPQLTVNRAQRVEVTKVVDASGDAVEAALSRSLKVDTVLPAFLRIGFPRPLVAYGEGLSVGSMRTIHFAGAEGDPPGDLVMRVSERRPGFVRFETVSDGSKLTQWLRWDSSEVEWRCIDAGHTEVRWRVNFERQLDPAWYFTPWEREAVREAAGYLIEANAVPVGGAAR